MEKVMEKVEGGQAEDTYGSELQVGDRVLARDSHGFWCAAKVIKALKPQP